MSYFDKDLSFNIKTLFTKSDLAVQVSNLLIELNSLNSNQELLKVYQDLKEKKNNFYNSYNFISNEIKQKIVVLIDQIFDLRVRNIEIQQDINSLSIAIKNFAIENTKDLLNKDSSKYKVFLNKYNETLTISQDILKHQLDVQSLVETQDLLDKSYSSKMIEVDYQLLKLNDVINSFKEIKTPHLFEAYSKQFNKSFEYKELIEESDIKFKDLKKQIYKNCSIIDIDSYKSLSNNSLFNDLFKPNSFN